MTRRAATVVVVALVVAACGTGRDDLSTPPLVTTTNAPVADDAGGGGAGLVEPPVTPPPVEIDQVECPEDLVDETVACGVVTVPVDRADPGLGTTRITIATMQGYDPGFVTPVAVLQGGPGGSSSALAGWFPQQPFTQVFVDQRGTGFAGPDFDCTELDAALPTVLAAESPEGGVVYQEAVDDCARRLDDDPVLAGTHSEAHAADVAEVMAALGYGRWVAYGVSYGSTIGLELLRDAPAGLVGVVLDGVYPPELDVDAALVESATAAVGELDAACAVDAICRGYLDGESFTTTMERVIAGLDADPIVVPVKGRDLGIDRDVDVVLDGRRVAEFTFLLLYSESRMRYLPAVIGGLAGRDDSSARWLASTGARVMVASGEANDEGTFFAVQCHDRLPFTDGPGNGLSGFGAAVASAPLASSCAEWEREPAPAEADDPVASDIPTLLLSGRFDPITPPAFATAVAPRLGRVTEVVQDGRGHGIWYGDECIAEIVQSFVADPAREVDTSCAAEGVPVEWARP